LSDQAPPLWNDLKAAYGFFTGQFGEFARAASVPFVLMVAVSGTSLIWPEAGGLQILSGIVNAFLLGMFSVAWHRYHLAGQLPRPKFGADETVYAIYLLFIGFLPGLSVLLGIALAPLGMGVAVMAMLVGAMIALPVVFRLGLGFPATAANWPESPVERIPAVWRWTSGETGRFLKSGISLFLLLVFFMAPATLLQSMVLNGQWQGDAERIAQYGVIMLATAAQLAGWAVYATFYDLQFIRLSGWRCSQGEPNGR